MALILVAAFIGIPILEIAVFIQAGKLIGLGPTLAVVVLTAVLGAALVRHQGISTLVRARASLDAGRFPVAEVFDGFCLLLAGAFLLTPGFVTDLAGFLLLVPPVRAVLRDWAARKLEASGRVTVWNEAGTPPPGAEPGRTIDGEFVRVDDEHVEQRGDAEESSPWRRDPPDG